VSLENFINLSYIAQRLFYKSGHSFTRLFQKLKMPINSSILSWNDQVKQDDIKILEPKMMLSTNKVVSLFKDAYLNVLRRLM